MSQICKWINGNRQKATTKLLIRTPAVWLRLLYYVFLYFKEECLCITTPVNENLLRIIEFIDLHKGLVVH